MSTGQGQLNYVWFECYLELDGTAERFAEYFDPLRPQVTKRDEGFHKGVIDWSLEYNIGIRPSYLPNGDDFPFSLLLWGHLSAPQTGSYKIALTVDDCAEIYIDDEKVLNSVYTVHGHAEGWQYEVDVSLTEGFHSIIIGMVNSGGPDALRVGWKKPTDPVIAPIPKEYFYSHIPTTANQAKGIVTKRKQGVSRLVRIHKREDGSIMNSGYSSEDGKFALNVEKDVPFFVVVFDELTDDPFQNAKTVGAVTATR